MHIAICGSAPSSIHTAPVKDASYRAFTAGSQHAYPPMLYGDQHWDIWGCSPGLFGVAERVNRWFEVHRWEPGKEWFSPQYCQWLREFRGPVYTGRPIPEIPGSVVYPIERVEAEFSPYFLTSSLALMFALAILEIEDLRAKRASSPAIAAAYEGEAPDTIGLFGVDMSATEEYEYQRPGCQFFILEALRRGIRVYVPPEADILRPIPIYGISEWDDAYIKATARARELNMRRNEHQQRLATDQSQAQYLSGAIDNLNYFVKTWTSPYGLPAGVFISQDPAKPGLGGGITMRGGQDGSAAPAPEEPESPLLFGTAATSSAGVADQAPKEPEPVASSTRPPSRMRSKPIAKPGKAPRRRR